MIIEAIPQWNPEIHAQVTVKDGPVVPMAHSRAGGRYRVDSITIEYRWEVEPAPQWMAVRMELHGPRVKKDGTDSEMRHTDYLYGWELRALQSGDIVACEKWAWLLPLIESLRPTSPGVARPALGDANAAQGSASPIVKALRALDAHQERADKEGDAEVAWYYHRDYLENVLGLEPGYLDTTVFRRCAAIDGPDWEKD